MLLVEVRFAVPESGRTTLHLQHLPEMSKLFTIPVNARFRPASSFQGRYINIRDLEDGVRFLGTLVYLGLGTCIVSWLTGEFGADIRILYRVLARGSQN